MRSGVCEDATNIDSQVPGEARGQAAAAEQKVADIRKGPPEGFERVQKRCAKSLPVPEGGPSRDQAI